ncbi:hypothetical protein ZHAS_00002402 [Anopheles sinensis]|uniref:Uncharacterized protein n=1 Tax=Anopheles sinensis TaxID=74873 RepID=A0A084VC69_ANOSI|nr:hypothetical protein ZHAS_00002402 [Anopheles sinensis]
MQLPRVRWRTIPGKITAISRAPLGRIRVNKRGYNDHPPGAAAPKFPGYSFPGVTDLSTRGTLDVKV